MTVHNVWIGITLLALVAGCDLPLAAQAAGADPMLNAAEEQIGRALFLRGFPAADDLHYDAAGKLLGAAQATEWTLSGFDLKQVTPQGAKEIELDGVRVAIRYNADNHQFERHPQKDETVRVRVEHGSDVRGFEQALDAIFAQGIDPRLQAATPAYWQHYFNPVTPWQGEDALAGETVYLLNGSPETKEIAPPKALSQTQPRAAPAAVVRDKVAGAVLLRTAIDAKGVPRRITVVRPLGYGLDERAVSSLAAWRFRPAMRNDQAVVVAVQIDVNFEVVQPR